MHSSMTRRAFLTRSSQAVLGASLGATALAACGTTPSTSSGPVTLTYGWWSNNPTKDNAMLTWLKGFEQSHPNIKIQPEILPWGNYWDKLKTTTAGGNAYDIIGMSSFSSAPFFKQGSLYELSQFSDYQDAVKSLTAGPLQLSTWDGKHYSLPIGVYIPLMGYNKDLLTAAGIPLPDPVTPMTFDEFMAMGKKLTKKQGSQYVQYALHPNNFIDVDMFVYMEGGSIYDNPVNPTKITVNTPQGIAGLTDYLSLFSENIAVPYDQLNNGPWGAGDLPSLQTGKVAFARSGAFYFQEMGSNLSVAPLFSINGNRAVTGAANGLSIYAGSKHPNEAWEFLKWAAQTQAELQFATFSDIPASQGALAKLDTVISPKAYVPTLVSGLSAFKPAVMTTNPQISTALSDIIVDMVHGKITPAQAAAQMEQQGNAALASS